jgi:hypothetical protein
VLLFNERLLLLLFISLSNQSGNFRINRRKLDATPGTTQLPIQWVRGGGDLSLGVKRTGREADHSHPSSVKFKECVELYLHSPIRLHGMVLSEAQGQLYLYILLHIEFT